MGFGVVVLAPRVPCGGPRPARPIQRFVDDAVRGKWQAGKPHNSYSCNSTLMVHKTMILSRHCHLQALQTQPMVSFLLDGAPNFRQRAGANFGRVLAQNLPRCLFTGGEVTSHSGFALVRSERTRLRRRRGPPGLPAGRRVAGRARSSPAYCQFIASRGRVTTVLRTYVIVQGQSTLLNQDNHRTLPVFVRQETLQQTTSSFLLSPMRMVSVVLT